MSAAIVIRKFYTLDELNKVLAEDVMCDRGLDLEAFSAEREVAIIATLLGDALTGLRVEVTITGGTTPQGSS